MKKIGLLIEYKDGAPKPANRGMITAARGQGRRLYAISLEPVAEPVRQELGRYGVDEILTVPVAPGGWHPERWSQAVVSVIRDLDLDVLMGLTTAQGRDLLPRIAAALDAPLVMDCIAVDVDAQTVKTSQYSGKIMATLKLSGSRVVYGMRPNAIPAKESPAEARLVHHPAVPAPEEKMRLLEVIAGDAGAQNLSEADIIISGGRGMKNGDNFKLLFDCARALGGAAVGASRVAVDEGWVPYAMQVGQTGAKVNPKVYIACGISGSVQHFAGMKTAGMIIAINTDAEAAIMSNCDYAVRADLFDVLAEMIRLLPGDDGHG
jgi:electron transfer flavoprotein alpha subunit